MSNKKKPNARTFSSYQEDHDDVENEKGKKAKITFQDVTIVCDDQKAIETNATIPLMQSLKNVMGASQAQQETAFLVSQSQKMATQWEMITIGNKTPSIRKVANYLSHRVNSEFGMVGITFVLENKETNEVWMGQTPGSLIITNVETKTKETIRLPDAPVCAVWWKHENEKFLVIVSVFSQIIFVNCNTKEIKYTICDRSGCARNIMLHENTLFIGYDNQMILYSLVQQKSKVKFATPSTSFCFLNNEKSLVASFNSQGNELNIRKVDSEYTCESLKNAFLSGENCNNMIFHMEKQILVLCNNAKNSALVIWKLDLQNIQNSVMLGKIEKPFECSCKLVKFIGYGDHVKILLCSETDQFYTISLDTLKVSHVTTW